MIIKDKLFGTSLRIVIDSYQYKVQKKKGKLKSGETNWVSIGYFQTLGGAVNKIVRMKSENKRDAVNLKQYVSQHETLVKQIHDRLNF